MLYRKGHMLWGRHEFVCLVLFSHTDMNQLTNNLLNLSYQCGFLFGEKININLMLRLTYFHGAIPWSSLLKIELQTKTIINLEKDFEYCSHRNTSAIAGCLLRNHTLTFTCGTWNTLLTHEHRGKKDLLLRPPPPPSLLKEKYNCFNYWSFRLSNFDPKGKRDFFSLQMTSSGMFGGVS